MNIIGKYDFSDTINWSIETSNQKIMLKMRDGNSFVINWETANEIKRIIEEESGVKRK